MAVSPSPPTQPHHAQTHATNNSSAAAHSGTGTTPGTSANASVSTIPTKSSIRLVFSQGGSTCLLRPNAVVRGHVELKLIKPCYSAGIRVKLRGKCRRPFLASGTNRVAHSNKSRPLLLLVGKRRKEAPGVKSKKQRALAPPRPAPIHPSLQHLAAPQNGCASLSFIFIFIFMDRPSCTDTRHGDNSSPVVV